MGRPNPKYISTSHVERQVLKMRTQLRRFTRLTNTSLEEGGQSLLAIALHYMHYNFFRIHQALRVTPAMEAGISNHVWSIKEVVEALDEEKQEQAAQRN